MRQPPEFITIVSGLPRSGTSMMMQMLVAGGLPPMKDEIRSADEDNPHGYYEFERVKQLKEDKAWLPDSKGKVVKMVYKLLYDLPPEGFEYRVLFMRRELKEVIASQNVMLERKGKAGGPIDEDQLIDIFKTHIAKVEAYMNGLPSFKYIEVNYNELLKDPAAHAGTINAFLDNALDNEKMLGAVDKSLYRNRA